MSEIQVRRKELADLAEVVGFRENQVLLMPLGDMEEIGLGSEVVARGTSLRVRVGDGLLGQVLDGLGRPIDGLGPLDACGEMLINRTPPPAMQRQRIRPAGVRNTGG